MGDVHVAGAHVLARASERGLRIRVDDEGFVQRGFGSYTPVLAHPPSDAASIAPTIHTDLRIIVPVSDFRIPAIMPAPHS